MYMFKYYATNVLQSDISGKKTRNIGSVIISQKKELELDVNLVIRKRMVLACSTTSSVVFGGLHRKGNKAVCLDWKPASLRKTLIVEKVSQN